MIASLGLAFTDWDRLSAPRKPGRGAIIGVHLMNSVVHEPQVHTHDAERRPIRVVAAVGFNPLSQRLLRSAAELSAGLGGDLIAIHIRPPGRLPGAYQEMLQICLQEAHRLGAEAHIVTARDVATTLISEAQSLGATHLVVGQSDDTWRNGLHGTIVSRLLRLIHDRRAMIDLYIVAGTVQG